jgi:uncharacterized protein YerC
MTRVSKRALDTAVIDELFCQLARVIGRAHGKRMELLLHALFTPAEHIMFTKRLAVIVLLHEEVSMYKIVRMLHMSLSTVSSMKERYEAGEYKAVTSTLGMSKREREQFWKTVGLILRGGMPSRGRDRWEWLDQHFPRTPQK